jgi:ERF superfamily
VSRPKAPLPLVDKIAQAFEAVGKLPRAGRNTTRHYPYTRATDVFEAVRSHLFRRGVLICPTENTPEYVQVGPSNGGEQITECRLQVTYTFRDALEKLEPMVVNGIGRDVEDKALYKAQTGAQKALLKRFGLMAEETDDPEWDGQQSPGETLDDAAPLRTPRKEKPLAAYQIENIREAMTNTGKTEEQLSQAVASIGHTPVLAAVKQKHFKQLFKWASDGRGTVSAPKVPAAPDQGALPLRAAPAPIQMKIGAKRIEFEPKEKGYAL